MKVALFFGGMSGEYAVSLSSAAAIRAGLLALGHEVFCVGIDRRGAWHLTAGDGEAIARDAWQAGARPCFLSPDRGQGGLYVGTETGAWERLLPDVLFPAMHGRYGEDGCIQGLFALSGIPFVGCDARASALCMDKDATKTVLSRAGIPVLPWVTLRGANRDGTRAAEAVARVLSYPIFLKPVRGGSSLGAGRVAGPEYLPAALARARGEDDTVLCEPFVPAREIEVALLETGGRLAVSEPGEVLVPPGDFYTYAAKYEKKTALRDRADLTPHTAKKMRDMAAAAFSLLSCRGLCRVDFFLTRAGEIYLNEVNTLPGFTPGSMYARLMATAGFDFPALLSSLLSGARAG